MALGTNLSTNTGSQPLKWLSLSAKLIFQKLLHHIIALKRPKHSLEKGQVTWSGKMTYSRLWPIILFWIFKAVTKYWILSRGKNTEFKFPLHCEAQCELATISQLHPYSCEFTLVFGISRWEFQPCNLFISAALT